MKVGPLIDRVFQRMGTAHNTMPIIDEAVRATILELGFNIAPSGEIVDPRPALRDDRGPAVWRGMPRRGGRK